MHSQHLELLPLDQQHLVRRAAAGIEVGFARVENLAATLGQVIQ
jgi:hypothetical protein